MNAALLIALGVVFIIIGWALPFVESLPVIFIGGVTAGIGLSRAVRS